MPELRLDAGPSLVRPWRTADLTSLVRHANNPNIAAQLRDAFPHPYTREAGVEWLRVAVGMRPVTKFAIEIDGEAVGGVGFLIGRDIERCSAEIGYWLSEAYWGRGITMGALRAVTRHAFEEHDLRRIFAVPFADNTRSRRVLEKAGYTLEGIMRHSALKSGRIRDQALYAVVR